MDRATDFDEFVQAIAQLVDSIPSARAFTPSQLVTWFQDLEDFDLREVKRALQEIRRSRNDAFLPSVGQVRAWIVGGEDERAVTAWGRLLGALETHGIYRSVDFQDPVLHTVIDQMGGWVRLVDQFGDSPQELSYRRHEFVQTYKAFSKKLPGPAPTHLRGLAEIANGDSRGHWDHGFDHVDPVLVLSENGRDVVRRRALPAPTMPALPVGQVDVKGLIAEVSRVLSQVSSGGGNRGGEVQPGTGVQDGGGAVGDLSPRPERREDGRL